MDYEIFFWICLLIVLKSITVGSDFNFMNWFKRGKRYTTWYFERESFQEWMDKQ